MSNEREFQNAVVEALQLHLYLVNHNPTSATTAGFRTVLDYDGAGFFDIVAMRPEAPVIALELKDGSRLSSDQKDWQEAGRGDGRYATMLTPRQMPAFLAHLDAIDEQYPVPRGWKATLTSRSMRRGLKRLNTQVSTGAKERTLMLAPPPIGSAVTVNSGSQVFILRGVNPDRSYTVYGPMTWTGAKWVPHPKSRKRVCFRSIPATSVLKLAKESR